jgi:hypothetical protein
LLRQFPPSHHASQHKTHCQCLSPLRDPHLREFDHSLRAAVGWQCHHHHHHRATGCVAAAAAARTRRAARNTTTAETARGGGGGGGLRYHHRPRAAPPWRCTGRATAIRYAAGRWRRYAVAAACLLTGNCPFCALSLRRRRRATRCCAEPRRRLTLDSNRSEASQPAASTQL